MRPFFFFYGKLACTRWQPQNLDTLKLSRGLPLCENPLRTTGFLFFLSWEAFKFTDRFLDDNKANLFFCALLSVTNYMIKKKNVLQWNFNLVGGFRKKKT